MNLKRIEWLDFLKGLAILSVVFLHSFNGYNVDGTPYGYILKYLTSFHMALFFSLSGYMFNINVSNYKTKIKKKAKALLIPYVIYGIVIGFILENFRVIIRGHDFDFMSHLKNVLLLRRSHLACWFLIVLFGTYIFEYLITFLTKKVKNKNIFYMIINFILLIIPFIFSNAMVFNLFKLKWIFLSCFFFAFGYFLKYVKIKNVFSMLLLVLGIVICFINSKCTYSSFSFGNPCLFVLSSICSIAGWVTLIRNIYVDSKNLLKKLINWFGKNSIIILPTHLIYIYTIRIIEKLFNMQIHTFPPLITFIFLIFFEIITIRYMPKFVKKTFGK